MEELITSLFLPTTQITIIVGIAEIIKNIGVHPKYIPLVDLALGLISGFIVYWGVYDFITSMMIGITYGLSACGAFSGFKNIMKGSGKDE